MESDTEIANFALSHLGISKSIAELTSEKSAEANAIRRIYKNTLDEVLSDFAWPFASKTITIGLVESNPNTEWAFSYRYPADSVCIRRILSGIRSDTQESRVPYKIAQDDKALLIYTDKEDAEAEYTVRETRVNLYPPDFCSAFSLLIASYIAPQITGGDPFKLGDRALKLYQAAINGAQASALNEEQSDQLPDAESIRART